MDGKKNALLRGILIIAAILLVLPAVSVGEQAKAESAVQSINVVIPEVLRVSINQSEIAFSESVEEQKVTLKILSNSPQAWMLRVNAPMVQGQLEWSLDGTSWNPMGDTQEVIHGGNTKGWKEFSVYYRLKQAGELKENVQLNLTYDLTTDKMRG
jgi:hypothetical protein